jgi:cardiolipin synthase
MPPWLNLPNGVTILRLLLTPVVIQAIVTHRPAIAMAVFIAAAITDILDGALARRLGVPTAAGAYLDPLADKCLLGGVFLALAAGRYVPWWFVGIVFGRDLFILCGAGVFYLFTPIRKFPPSIWGKISTFIQIDTAVVWMARNMLQIWQIDTLAMIMLWLCSAATAWSGIHYAWRSWQLAKVH